MDNLTEIKGIGPARQQWLRKTLNIRSFEDLANLSVAEIMERLKADRQISSHYEIEEWIAQASILAEKKNEEHNLLRDNGWKPFASFVVEFQVSGQQKRTVVHHIESDAGTSWPGIERVQLSDWMAEQIAQPEQQMPINAVVEIVDFQVFQAGRPIFSGKADPMATAFLGFVRADEPFALQVSFRKEELPKSGQFSIEFLAHHIETDSQIVLGSNGPYPFIDGELVYTAQLPDLHLQQGLYCLKVVIHQPTTNPVYFEAPVMQVI